MKCLKNWITGVITKRVAREICVLINEEQERLQRMQSAFESPSSEDMAAYIRLQHKICLCQDLKVRVADRYHIIPIL